MGKKNSTALARRTSSLPALLGRELPKYFTREEVHRILEATENERDKLMLNLMWQTGLRVSELLSLKPSNIDFRGGVLKVPTLKRKGHPFRVIPLQPSLLGELARFIASNKIGDEERLFPLTRFRVFQIVKEACKRAGIEDERAHPHTFRHSFAVHCVLHGVPVLVLNEWLGHSNIENTLIYTKVLASDSRQFYDRLPF